MAPNSSKSSIRSNFSMWRSVDTQAVIQVRDVEKRASEILSIEAMKYDEVDEVFPHMLDDTVDTSSMNLDMNWEK